MTCQQTLARARDTISACGVLAARVGARSRSGAASRSVRQLTTIALTMSHEAGTASPPHVLLVPHRRQVVPQGQTRRSDPGKPAPTCSLTGLCHPLAVQQGFARPAAKHGATRAEFGD